MKLKTIIMLFTALTVFTVLAALVMYYDSIKIAASNEDAIVSESHIKNIQNSIAQLIGRYRKIALTLSRHEELYLSLVDENPVSLGRANQILDLFNASLTTSVCYLLNRDGVVVASSNRHDSDSFVGMDYSFRPYFINAINGRPFVYLASGVTSGRRGIYFSIPVYASNSDSIIGVSVIKEEVANIEDDILFRHYPLHVEHHDVIAIASEDSVVFISDHDDLLFKTLWQVDGDAIGHVASSRQFGKGPWVWSGFEKTGNGKVIDQSSRHYNLLVSPINDLPGWQVIHLSDSDAISDRIFRMVFKTAGYAFVFLLLFIGSVLAVLNFLAGKAERELRKSEERYRSVTETVNEGIILQEASGKIVTWNTGAEGIFGICAADVIGKTTQDRNWSTIHDDGSPYEGNEHPSIKTLSSGKPHRNEIMGVFRPDGELRWISVNTNPLFQENEDKPYAVAISFSDITDLKRERDQSQRYLDVAGVMILVLNDRGEITLANRKACSILEASESELIGKNWFSHFLPAENVDRVIHAFQELMKGNVDGSEYFENKVLTSSGGEKVIAWHNTVLRSDQDEIIGTLSSGEDITDRKKAEAQLEKERDLMERIMETSPAGIMRINADGCVVYANRRAETIFDISLSTLEGPGYRDLAWKITDFYGKPYPDELLPFSIIRKTGRSVSDIQHALEWPDGRQVFLSVNAAPLFDRSGGFDGMVATLDDITEKYKAEQSYKMLFSEMLDGFALHEIICDDSGVPVNYRFLAVNPAFERLTGLKGRSIIGRTVLDVLPETEHHWIEDYGRVALTGIPVCFERYSNELSRHFQVTVFRPAKNQFACIVVDVTDRKNMETRLLQAQKMESIGSLAGGIAHDFNNLLFPIIGMAELLLDDLPPGSLEYANAREILKAGKRGGELVKQILAFSRQAEKKTMPIRIQQVLKDVLKLSRSTIPSDIEITRDIDLDCGLVMANPTQVHQIVMNLITNAYHALEPGGGRICVGLRETTLNPADVSDGRLPPGRFAVLSVSDTGSGIEPDVLNKMFDPYFTTKEQGKGTGLGLSIVYGIVRDYGGDIRVRTQVGAGTTFDIFLPVIEALGETEPARTAESDIPGTERILLIDDEESIAYLGKQMLERTGYTVTAKTSSTDALNAFIAGPDSFDLVITDMTMPNLTGDQLAREVLAIRPDIPVIICTGFSERIDRERAEALGVKGILMKPIVRSDLAAMVRKALDA